jgi:hypothetical protein
MLVFLSGHENAGMHSPSPQGQNFRIEVLHSGAAQRAQHMEVLSDECTACRKRKASMISFHGA